MKEKKVEVWRELRIYCSFDLLNVAQSMPVKTVPYPMALLGGLGTLRGEPNGPLVAWF